MYPCFFACSKIFCVSHIVYKRSYSFAFIIPPETIYSFPLWGLKGKGVIISIQSSAEPIWMWIVVLIRFSTLLAFSYFLALLIPWFNYDSNKSPSP